MPSPGRWGAQGQGCIRLCTPARPCCCSASSPLSSPTSSTTGGSSCRKGGCGGKAEGLTKYWQVFLSQVGPYDIPRLLPSIFFEGPGVGKHILGVKAFLPWAFYHIHTHACTLISADPSLALSMALRAHWLDLTLGGPLIKDCFWDSSIHVSRKGWHMLLNLCFHMAMTSAVFAGGITLTNSQIVCQAVSGRG